MTVEAPDNGASLLSGVRRVRETRTTMLVGDVLRISPSIALALGKAVIVVMAGYVATGSVLELFFEANDNDPPMWDDDQQCGICGHFCPLSSGPLNFCMCWHTVMTGGGCSCPVCAG